MEFFHEGGRDHVVSADRAKQLLAGMVEQWGDVRRVLIIPPDITRFYSWAGELTCLLHELLRDRCELEVLPALGTHAPMSAAERQRMFPGVPDNLFRVHDWRNGLAYLGDVPSAFIEEVSEGKLNYSIRVELNKRLLEGNWDRIVSVGQLVPHEVIGIANQVKNIFVGVGGSDIINKSHYLGAVHGMERMMGRADTPVRRVLQYAHENYAAHLPITFLLTVRGKDAAGQLVTRGLYASDDESGFQRGAELCQQVNLDFLDRAPRKVVVYLEPEEFKSTWLGNKAVYRTRMAIADAGELVVLAPGVKEFGEDPEIDRLIRKYGYRGTPATLASVALHPELGANLSAAAHLIHGSSEGRFHITYCPGRLTRQEIESVNFQFADPTAMMERYSPDRLRDGWNTLPDGEEVFYVSNPGLGLWCDRQRFV